MRYFLIICGVLVCFVGWNQFLPGNNHGTFSILSPTGKQLLPQSYHDLDSFDSKGLTYFAEFDRYGILNTQGEVVYPAKYKRIIQIGGGLYQCQTELGTVLIDFSQPNIEGIEMDEAELVQPSWYRVSYKDSAFLINIHSKIQIPIDENNRPSFQVDYAWFPPTEEGSLGQLFDSKGEKVLLDVQRPYFTQFSLFIKNSRESKLILNDDVVLFPVDVNAVQISGGHIQYSSQGNTYIMDLETKSVIFSAPYDDLRDLGKYWLTVKNDKEGIITKSGTLILPPKYNQIYPSGAFFFVQGDGGQGVTDSLGQVILPCAFDYIYSDAEFFHVFTSSFAGLYSRKKNAMLFPCIYDEIKIDEGEIRALSGDLMKVCKIDDQHTILSELVLNDVLVMRRPNMLGDFDRRLLSQGWFFEEEAVYDEEGFAMGSQRNWGLLSDTGSIILEAKFREPKYIPGSNINLLPKGKIEMKYAGLNEFKLDAYSLINNKTGRPAITDIIVSMDTMDGLNRGYVRYISNKDMGIILGDNSTRTYNFMETNDDRYIRVCNFKSVRDSLDKRKEVSWPGIDLNNAARQWIEYKMSPSAQGLSKIELGGAKWNFLLPDGSELLSEPMDFVEPFYREVSIVEKEGAWGVMNLDSMVIPTKYKNVRRFSEISDTLFLVSYIPQGARYLDSLGNPLGVEIQRLGRSNEHLLQVEVEKEKWLIDQNYAPVVRGERSFRFLEEGYFYSKYRKIFELYAPNGTLLSESGMEPERIMGDAFVVFKNGSKIGLADFNGAVIQSPICKEIKFQGDKIYVDLGDSKQLFSGEFELIKKIKSGTFLVDEANGNWAVHKKQKLVIYSAITGKKIRSFSSEKSPVLHSDWVIFKGKSAFVESYASEQHIDLGLDVDEVDFYTYGYIVSASDGRVYLFDRAWNRIANELEIKRIKQLGEGVLLVRASQGQFIINDKLIKPIGASARISGTYSDGCILVNENGSYYFMDVNGENPFKRKFRKAHPFRNGFASVAFSQGWTIIDRQGHAQTLPVFEEIKPMGARVFTTNKQELYGLFDRNGREILPVEFQKLTKVSDGILQGIKQGEIFYFDYEGKQLGEWK